MLMCVSKSHEMEWSILGLLGVVHGRASTPEQEGGIPDSHIH